MNHEHDEHERGDERLLSMAVAEATGRGPQDLELRILARLGTEPVPVRPAKSWLAAAALLLAGTAVVVSVWVAMRSSETTSRASATGAQDPQPKKADAVARKVTDADVPKRSDYDIEDAAVDCIAAIGKAADLPFASAVLEQKVRWKSAKATPRQALAAVAAAAGAHLEQFGAVLAVVPGAAPVELTVTLRREAMPVHELFEIVASEAQANLVVAGSVTGQVAVDVTDCPWRDLVALLSDAVGAQVAGSGRVLAIVSKSQVPVPRTYFDFDRVDLTRVVFTIGKNNGVAVQSDADLSGQVTMRGKNCPALDMLQAIAATKGCEVGRPVGKLLWRKAEDAVVHRLVRLPENVATVTFELDRAFCFLVAPENFATQCQLEGTVSVFCSSAPRRHVLGAVAAVAGGWIELREGNVVEFVR